MNVKVRHALTNFIVHRHECAVGFHSELNRASQKLHIAKERLD